MPFTYSDPDVFMEHEGVEVYHVYKDDDMSQGARWYWYTTNIEGTDSDSHGENGTFDVRCLAAAPNEGANDWSIADIRTIIAVAIDSGEIVAPIEEDS